jgi:uncharacterized protein (DUF2141 family)
MMRRLAAMLIAAPLLAANEPTATLDVELSGLRNTHGSVHACLTRNPAHFPDCKSDPLALKRTVQASAGHIDFKGVSPGRYALSVFHDENDNLKLDKILGIPKDGFGFSRNPVIRFGPPRFDKVSIDLAPGFTRTGVRMQYLL